MTLQPRIDTPTFCDQPPYYQTLVIIRAILESELKEFPHHQCYKAARVVSKVIGLAEIAGYYLPDPEHSSDHRLQHVWNYDRRHKIHIDLTVDQFDPALPMIAILPQRTDRLVARYYHTLRQRRMSLENLENIIIRCQSVAHLVSR